MRNRLAFAAVLASCTAFALPLAAQSTVSFELFTTLPTQLSLPQYSTIGNVVAGDFNNDGKLDLLTGGQNEPGANNQLGILFSAGNGDGTFQGPVTALTTPSSLSLRWT